MQTLVNLETQSLSSKTDDTSYADSDIKPLPPLSGFGHLSSMRIQGSPPRIFITFIFYLYAEDCNAITLR